MTGYIDIVCNPYTPYVVENKMMGVDNEFQDQVRMSDTMRNGVEIKDYIKKMDKAGIERSLLISARAGDLNVKGSREITYEYVRELCDKHPDRFSGLAGIDPTKGMEQLKELEIAVKEYGFVGAHWYPHWFSIPPDAPQIYPVYAKCCELDIPIMMQVGQNLIYSRDRRLPSVARPILLDQVAIDFPELVIIGIHIGVPWTDEMIAMCWKHNNVYTAGDAYAPKHWPKQYVHYANSYGRHKVLFGTDWPVIDPERAVKEVSEFGMREESHRMLMRENALRIFKKI
ncbi:MAG: amidohydrolase family protein [Pseudomonadota bacterium]|nr:amidohydrolase family protein [Pseudomonadota bacterium]